MCFYKVGSVKINGFHAIAWQKCRKRLPPYIEGVWDGVSCGQSRAWYWISPGIDSGGYFLDCCSEVGSGLAQDRFV